VRNGEELEAFMSVLGMNPHEKKFAEKCAAKLAGNEPNAKGDGGKVRE